MDREMRGITAIEMLVVVAIMGLMLGVIIPNFLKWRKSLSIENDVYKIYAFIQQLRIKAFTTKTSYTVSANGKQVCAGSACIDLSNNFTGSITINERGILSNGAISATDTGYGEHYNCVVASVVRARKGKLNGTACEAK